MLVFIDESGDLGFKFEKGSARFFTIALVAFEDSNAAQRCQDAIEALGRTLSLPPRYEFHFHDDSHARRLAFLSAVARQQFSCYTFTLDKTSPRLTGEGFRHKESGYKWVCRIALENMGNALSDAMIVVMARATGDSGSRSETTYDGNLTPT